MDNFYDKHTKVWSGSKVESQYNLEHNSVGKILYEQMRNGPSKVIQIDDVTGKSLTNREALTWAIRLAQHFKEMRLGHDDIVGITARNSTYVMPLALGCFLNCVPFHAVNPNFDESTLSHCFGITKPQIVFCDGSDYEKVLAATQSFKPLIYTISEHIEGVASVFDLLEPTKTELLYQPEKLTLGAKQTVAILCSSGTTGLPKAVPCAANIFLYSIPLLASEDVFFSFSGLDWFSGCLFMILNCYTGCTRIITNKSFTPEHFVEISKKYKVTNVVFSACYLAALTDCPHFTTDNVGSITTIQTGGSRITKNTLAKIQKVLNHTIISNVYAITEIGAISINSGLDGGNTVGKLMPNMKLRIVDEQDTNLGHNETGEILLNHPYHWAGYYDNPLETLRMRDSSGWFHTGDLGYMDEDNFLYIIDRKKEVSKYLEFDYLPSEIESAVRELPDIVDCCVVSVYDDHFGDVAGALVIKSAGSLLKEQEIVDHVKLRLIALHKQLHNGVVFVEKLPQNFNGKILMKDAKELFMKLKNLKLKL